ncbi:hypothetical protein WN51_14040 [Melipona quadrifasciata]|uniref:Uncharacterized protein n=1 Tax=Melipona quadrifasciata TaxID=166423 RepID=A0A0N0BFX3_9HYME|nr:hypothetical protein WN51_14040 [Melipona quadrifasciata]
MLDRGEGFSPLVSGKRRGVKWRDQTPERTGEERREASRPKTAKEEEGDKNATGAAGIEGVTGPGFSWSRRLGYAQAASGCAPSVEVLPICDVAANKAKCGNTAKMRAPTSLAGSYTSICGKESLLSAPPLMTLGSDSETKRIRLSSPSPTHYHKSFQHPSPQTHHLQSLSLSHDTNSNENAN